MFSFIGALAGLASGLALSEPDPREIERSAGPKVEPARDAAGLARQLNGMFFKFSSMRGSIERVKPAVREGKADEGTLMRLLLFCTTGKWNFKEERQRRSLDAVAALIGLEYQRWSEVIAAANEAVRRRGGAIVPFGDLKPPRFGTQDAKAVKDPRSALDRIEAFADNVLSRIDELIDRLEGEG